MIHTLRLRLMVTRFMFGKRPLLNTVNLADMRTFYFIRNFMTQYAAARGKHPEVGRLTHRAATWGFGHSR
jgi:hypothetical protein